MSTVLPLRDPAQPSRLGFRTERALKVFVTGGNGFIGSVVVRLLHAAGHTVRVLVRPQANTERIAAVPVERVVGDVRDGALLRRAIAGQDAVIHMAGLSSWDLIDSPQMGETTQGGTAGVLAAAREKPGTRVVYVSSVLAVGSTYTPEPIDETFPYRLDADKQLVHSHHKHRAELLCRQAFDEGVDVVVVNPAEVYGPNDLGLITASNLVDFAKSNPVLVCHGGTSIVHVEDVARGILAAVNRGRAGERYILGGENITHRQLATLFLELAGQDKRVVTLPNRPLRAFTRVAQSLRIPLPYNPRVVPYATRYFWVDAAKARRELGVDFRSARDTLSPTVAWLKSAGLIG
ncbi:MAG TPA: NAD-dependent epimerase/dehydratase family protein [Pirellulales bacterium]|nr:NAD-dependent epimerase/dehydratase family protein [Pirellulales bacterium]